jgi:hypothetical protein
VHQLELVASSLASQVAPSFTLFGTATAAGDIEDDIDFLREEQRAQDRGRSTSLRKR